MREFGYIFDLVQTTDHSCLQEDVHIDIFCKYLIYKIGNPFHTTISLYYTKNIICGNVTALIKMRCILHILCLNKDISSPSVCMAALC